MMRNLVTMGLNDIEKSVVKATYDDDLVPKEKHVVFLVECTHTYDIVSLFDRRLAMGKWNVVFKSLIVLHRLSIEGADRIMKDLSLNHHTFNLRSFFDGSIGSVDHSDFVTKYADYLAQKVYVYKLLGVSVERKPPSESKEWARRLGGFDLVKALPALSQQFDRLLLCAPYGGDVVGLAIPIAALTLLVRDAFRIYSCLTVLMLGVVDHYQELDAPQTKLVLTVCTTFRAQNIRFKKWTHELSQVGFSHEKLFPDLVPIPDALFELLTDHMNNRAGSRGGGAAVASPAQPAAAAAGARKKPVAAAAAAAPVAASTSAAGAGAKKKPRAPAPPPEESSEEDAMDSNSDEDEEVAPVRRKAAAMAVSGKKAAAAQPAAAAAPASAAATKKQRAAAAAAAAAAEEESSEEESSSEDEEERARKAAKAARKEARRLKREAKAKKAAAAAAEEEDDDEEEEEEPAPAPVPVKKPKKKPAAAAAAPGEVDLISVLSAPSVAQPTPFFVSAQPQQQQAPPSYNSAQQQQQQGGFYGGVMQPMNAFSPYNPAPQQYGGGGGAAYNPMAGLAPLSSASSSRGRAASINPGEENTTAVGGIYDPSSGSARGAGGDPFADVAPNLAGSPVKPKTKKAAR